MINKSLGFALVIACCSSPMATLGSSPPTTVFQQVVFEANFDDTLLSTENEAPVETSSTTFENGVSGKGVLIDPGDVLRYAGSGNIDASAGTLSMWVRPNWNPGTFLYRIMVLGNTLHNFEIHVDEGSQLAFSVNTSQIDGKPIKVAFADTDNWAADNWIFLTFTWSSEKIVIYTNGRHAGEQEVGFDIPATVGDDIHLGGRDGGNAFDGVMDDVRVYDQPLTAEAVQSAYEGYLQQSQLISVIDIFDRNVTSGITLVDWEGPVSNPALKYFLKGTAALDYPLSVNMFSSEERAMFSLPSTISTNGPAKSMVLTSSDDLESFLFSVYMDENFDNETFDLVLQYTVAGLPSRQDIPVTVIDQDVDRPLTYPATVDFSEARDAFMLDPNTQAVIIQAAEDWLYFVDGSGIDELPIGGSSLGIGGQDHLFDEKTVTNPVAYSGYYLYAFGNTNQSECVCSTGSPNRELLQTSGGEVVPIFRIGALHLNLYGQAYQTEPTGWEVLSPFENWSQEGFIGTDMYSLAKHEIGHAMVFENSPLFLLAQGRDPSNPYPDESLTPTPNGFTSPALTEYYPDEVVPLFINSLSHLYDVLDPASQMTPYGGGVEDEVMPTGRAMLTKLDILIMESVGYPIRDNEVTRALSLTVGGSLDGTLETVFDATLVGHGSIPVYHYDVSEGSLPDGLSLDSQTGTLSGTSTESGIFPVTFRVMDYDERSPDVTMAATISIAGPTAVDDLAEIPGNVALEQNYPNPFNSLTTIGYSVSKPGVVELSVYNVLGERVAVLVKGFNRVGEHSVTFDAAELTSGLYFYRLIAGDLSETRRMAVLR